MENKIKIMFHNLCCSRCKSDFDENSFEVIRKEKNVLVVKLHCEVCQKSFGIAFLGISDFNIKDDESKYELKMRNDFDPLTTDDVLDAHEFIKNLDEHWTKYLPN